MHELPCRIQKKERQSVWAFQRKYGTIKPTGASKKYILHVSASELHSIYFKLGLNRGRKQLYPPHICLCSWNGVHVPIAVLDYISAQPLSYY